MKARILLVDDHAVVRNGIKQIFAACTDISVDCEAETGTEAIELVKSRELDGVLLDLSLPDRGGLDVLRRIRAEKPTLPILVVSMHDEDQYAMNALKAGAKGYLSKSCAGEEVVTATRAVLAGRTYTSPEIASQLADARAKGKESDAPHERLSTREFQVFCKLAAGASVSVIATELFLSVKTVSAHRAHILEKMQFKTNADLTYYAIKNQLIE